MNTFLKALMVSFLLAAAGCSGVTSTPEPGLPTPTSPPTPAAQATPAPTEPVSTPSPQSTAASLITSRCNLLNSHDLASLYSSAEVMLPTPQVSQVNHVQFSTTNVSTNEISCGYFVFHQPGSTNMQMLQVNYWVDTPDQASPAAWAQVWTEASAQGGQPVSGVGDAAFYKNGKLTFKKGDVYMTIEVVGTSSSVNPTTSAGETEQLKIEKQIALDALKHF